MKERYQPQQMEKFTSKGAELIEQTEQEFGTSVIRILREKWSDTAPIKRNVSEILEMKNLMIEIKSSVDGQKHWSWSWKEAE